MQEPIKNSSIKKRCNLWLCKLRRVLPFTSIILLFGIVFVLQSWINSEGNTVKDRKVKELSEEKLPVNVVALELAPGPICEKVNLPGVVRPWMELSVVAEVPGKIVEKKVYEGQKVRVGDILAVIDKRSYQNAFNSARAAFLAAKANYDRILALNQDQLTTQSQLDDARANLETTKANMDTTALNLERCTITSPMAGVVDKVYIEKGKFMNGAQPVADILQMDRVKVSVSIPESDVDVVRNITDFTVSVDALGHKVFNGSQSYLAKSSEGLARSYLLKIAVNNPDGEILPDMFARVKIIKHQVQEGLAVPLFSISNGAGKKAVYVVEDNVARLTPIKTSIQEGWKVQASEGLAPGAKVIVVGQNDVKDGTKVDVIRTVKDPKELLQ